MRICCWIKLSLEVIVVLVPNHCALASCTGLPTYKTSDDQPHMCMLTASRWTGQLFQMVQLAAFNAVRPGLAHHPFVPVGLLRRSFVPTGLCLVRHSSRPSTPPVCPIRPSTPLMSSPSTPLFQPATPFIPALAPIGYHERSTKRSQE